MSAGELLPLPFQCPDLVMPISGRIRSSQSQGSTTILGGQNDSFDFTTLTELEKKFLLGLKLLINENGEINDLGKYQTDQWIVWMAYQHHHFILHLWKPSTGELKQISFKDVQLLPEFDENGEIKYLRVTYQNGFILIMNDDYDFMKELCQLLESAALGGSGGVAGGGEISST